MISVLLITAFQSSMSPANAPRTGSRRIRNSNGALPSNIDLSLAYVNQSSFINHQSYHRDEDHQTSRVGDP